MPTTSRRASSSRRRASRSSTSRARRSAPDAAARAASRARCAAADASPSRSVLGRRGSGVALVGYRDDMDVDAAREKNIDKAEQESERAPVGKEPENAPIGEAIADFHARDALAFGIPAHRAGTGDVVPDAAAWAGRQAFSADPGMNNGVDNRHQSWQIEPTAMELFANAVGADQTLFSTNGSSENVHVAMLATVKPGETLVMARNGHKSAFSGLVLSGARPVYVDPVYDGRWQVAHGVDPAALARVLDEHPEARAVMMFTPSYYGVSADVEALAESPSARTRSASCGRCRSRGPLRIRGPTAAGGCRTSSPSPRVVGDQRQPAGVVGAQPQGRPHRRVAPADRLRA